MKTLCLNGKNDWRYIDFDENRELTKKKRGCLMNWRVLRHWTCLNTGWVSNVKDVVEESYAFCKALDYTTTRLQKENDRWC